MIFEELPSDLFNIIYNAKSFNSQPDLITEIKCVKKYLQNHKIEHIPVDIETRLISDSEQNWMYDTFEKYDDYNIIDNEHSLLTADYGFSFLNSDKCLYLSEQKNIVITNILGIDIDKNELLRVYQLFIKHNDTRENAMLQNIYNYSKKNQYTQAVFLLGSGHRKSMIQKIAAYEKLSTLKLNWTFYGEAKETISQ